MSAQAIRKRPDPRATSSGIGGQHNAFRSQPATNLAGTAKFGEFREHQLQGLAILTPIGVVIGGVIGDWLRASF